MNELKTTSVGVKAPLCERLERKAAEEDMSLDELVDHVLRSYTEEFDLDEEDEGEEEDE